MMTETLYLHSFKKQISNILKNILNWNQNQLVLNVPNELNIQFSRHLQFGF